MQRSEWIECVLKERKEGSSWSVEVVIIAGLGRHFQLAGCRLLTARWDSVGCGDVDVYLSPVCITRSKAITNLLSPLESKPHPHIVEHSSKHSSMTMIATIHTTRRSRQWTHHMITDGMNRLKLPTAFTLLS